MNSANFKKSLLAWVLLALVVLGLVLVRMATEAPEPPETRADRETAASPVYIRDAAGDRPRPRPVATGAATSGQDENPAPPRVSITIEMPDQALEGVLARKTSTGGKVSEMNADDPRFPIEFFRAATLQKLGLDGKGTARFDAAVTALNDRIRETMRALADALADEKELTPELAACLKSELNADFAETYDDIGACVDAGRRGIVAALDLKDLLEPDVRASLLDVTLMLRRKKVPRAREMTGELLK